MSIDYITQVVRASSSSKSVDRPAKAKVMISIPIRIFCEEYDS